MDINTIATVAAFGLIGYYVVNKYMNNENDAQKEYCAKCGILLKKTNPVDQILSGKKTVIYEYKEGKYCQECHLKKNKTGEKK